ncbi:MAG: glycoside hydrolase family 3 C-terminal domain-containing protein [Oscillospiraceae bacterium]|nr:glycoside hydrolase family 3 C-terminal domain-containing protein [Oscillospiraceae bacterium]
MDDRKQELKRLKKEYKRSKRKHVTLWKTLGIVFLVLTLVFAPLSIVVKMFDNTMAAFFGGTFWELVDEDENATYFKSDFATNEEMTAYGEELCKQVEAEGAALLMNRDNALPLAANSQVSCFSNSSVNLVYGGTGSGNIDASKADNLKDALEKVGFGVNKTLWDFYLSDEIAKYARKGGGMVSLEATKVSEVPYHLYTQDVLDSVSAYGDAAIVVFSRVGGEGADMEFGETNYLSLNSDERNLMLQLSLMRKAGTIKKLIVLINTANALQVDFLKGNPYEVDAALWIGDVGISGVNAVAEILAGKVNPSGSLADTYCYNNYSSPAMQNFVATTYGGYDGKNIPSHASSYMIYQEGIYVGYKYYETRYEDFVMETGNAGKYAYDSDVAYPFGFGLSYTSFAYDNMAVVYNENTDKFEVTVTVTNTGAVAGKETVQVYSQAPYTDYDKENGVEKASVNLVGFGKTKMLEPGASETVTVYVDKRDLASYDAYGAKTYILDAGSYYLTVATDAHNAVNNILAAKGYTRDNTAYRMDADGNTALVHKWEQAEFDAKTYSVSKNGTPITNQLESADPNLYEGVEKEVKWLSRQDWEGTFPKEIVKLQLTQILIDDLQDGQYNPADYPTVEMPTLGADNGLKLYDMIGLSFDDPKWQTLLDQLTFDEMVALIGDSFHWRMPVASVQAPGTRDENGPQGLTASLLGSAGTQLEATAFTSEDVMAATFNVELMYEVGKVIGNNCLAADVVCLYGPGSNTHRTPYGGRNFEYYSEDGFLAGKICAAEVLGIQDKGVDVAIKHFALNDSEQDRIGQAVWLNEQAAREIYLRAFQYAFTEGKANGVMTAYTRWGAIWSGGHKGLMTNIMRKEWGNNGMSITDNVLTTYVTGADGILAGTTTYDAMMPYIVNELPKYENDPVIVSAMRQACHHNLYALANSSGMNGVGADTTVRVFETKLVVLCRVFAVVSLVVFIFFAVMWARGKKAWKTTEGYLNYRTMKNTLKEEKKR